MYGPSIYKSWHACRANTPLNFILGQIFFKEIATLKPGSAAIALPAFYPAGEPSINPIIN
jgi:hypothetical protein